MKPASNPHLPSVVAMGWRPMADPRETGPTPRPRILTGAFIFCAQSPVPVNKISSEVCSPTPIPFPEGGGNLTHRWRQTATAPVLRLQTGTRLSQRALYGNCRWVRGTLGPLADVSALAALTTQPGWPETNPGSSGTGKSPHTIRSLPGTWHCQGSPRRACPKLSSSSRLK